VSPECSPCPPPRSPSWGGPAFASNNPVTGNIVGNGNIPILSGNNVQIPVQIPVDICGNAVGLLGFANASCVGGARRYWMTAETSTAVLPGAGPPGTRRLLS
jgi:small secreted domain DUF320